MAFFPPGPPIGRIGMRRLVQQVLRLSSPASFSTSTSAASSTSPFVCRQCLKSKGQSKSPSALLSSVHRAKILREFRTPASFSPKRCLNTSNTKNTAAALSPTLEQTSELSAGAKSKVKYFPDTNSNSVAYWLLGSAVSVFGIVVFGGLTRLTESGYVQPLRKHPD